jgi:hypothetical protein
MSKTAVGLFEHPGVVDQIVRDLDASAFPRDKIRIVGEPREMQGDGVTSTPRIDFEVGFNRELTAIGASAPRSGCLRPRSAPWWRAGVGDRIE